MIPIALLLTQKRDGAFKCRAIVLGNRCVPNLNEQLYSPVVGMEALRSMLTVASREGDFVRVFDLDNAFLNAELAGAPAYVSTSQVWRNKAERALKRLKKALYGLPILP